MMINLHPVYYDCEASSLTGGCPVEIGWAWWDGEKIISESHLILPDPVWQIESSWDEQAEALHGISLERLRQEGEPAFNIARRMNDVLSGRELFADSPFDIEWTRQLFDVADLEPSFHLRRMLAPVLIEQLRVSRGVSQADAVTIVEKVRKKYPHTHRAGADARQWAELWLAIKLAESLNALNPWRSNGA